MQHPNTGLARVRLEPPEGRERSPPTVGSAGAFSSDGQIVGSQSPLTDRSLLRRSDGRIAASSGRRLLGCGLL
eukprot:1380105-Pyramimonas_sp.AAC.1